MTKQIFVCLLALMVAGGVFAAPRNGEDKKTASQAQGTALPILDEDEWVAEQLKKAERIENWFKPELVGQVFQKTQKMANYASMPSRFRKVIDANQANGFFSVGSYPRHIYPYCGGDWELIDSNGRIIVRHPALSSEKMMAIFEPEPDAEPFLMIPEKVLAKFSNEDKAWAKALQATVNENVAFLFDVPFFVPDMERAKRGDYAGRFIPEKYLVCDPERLAKIPSKLKDPIKEPFYPRWGFPIYDLGKVEKGLLSHPSDRTYFSDYKKMRVVDHLTLLNLDMVEPSNLQDSIGMVCVVQYTRALEGLQLLKEAPEAERAALQAAGTLTPNRERVLKEIAQLMAKRFPEAEQALNQTIEQKTFVKTLRPEKKANPRQRRPVRNARNAKPAPKGVYLLRPEYTSGRFAD